MNSILLIIAPLLGMQFKSYLDRADKDRQDQSERARELIMLFKDYMYQYVVLTQACKLRILASDEESKKISFKFYEKKYRISN